MLSNLVAASHSSKNLADISKPKLAPRNRGTKKSPRHRGVGLAVNSSRSSLLSLATGRFSVNDVQRDNARLLPVSFFNSDGKWEAGSVPSLLAIHEDDNARSFCAESNDGHVVVGGVEPLPRSAARERLRRTLFETGQLLVTTEDGLSRVWFAGVGDPDELFVEVVPRDATPAQEAEHAFPGCVCSLRDAEALLGRIYEGESSSRLTKLVERMRLDMKV